MDFQGHIFSKMHGLLKPRVDKKAPSISALLAQAIPALLVLLEKEIRGQTHYIYQILIKKI